MCFSFCCSGFFFLSRPLNRIEKFCWFAEVGILVRLTMRTIQLWRSMKEFPHALLPCMMHIWTPYCMAQRSPGCLCSVQNKFGVFFFTSWAEPSNTRMWFISAKWNLYCTKVCLTSDFMACLVPTPYRQLQWGFNGPSLLFSPINAARCANCLQEHKLPQAANGLI